MAVAFRADDSLELTVEYSTDGNGFQSEDSVRSVCQSGAGDYGYWDQLTLHGIDPPGGARFIRFSARPPAGRPSSAACVELSWVEIRYGP